jgi:hypothetical protein
MINNSELDLSRILRIKKQKEDKYSGIIDYHFNKVVRKIKDSYKNYQDFCYYEVGNFVTKLPMYDSTIVAKKLVDFMKSSGFKCKVIYQNYIYICWKPKVRKKDHLPVIMKNITYKIEEAAKNNQDKIMYEVPIFLSGFPWFDSIEATQLVARKIQNKGFIVKIFDDNNLLYISWNRSDLECKTNKKIKFETTEEKKMKALEKINFINEQRYVDFVNPKKSKKKITKSKITFEEDKPQRIFPKAERFCDDIYLRGLSNLKNDVRSLN